MPRTDFKGTAGRQVLPCPSAAAVQAQMGSHSSPEPLSRTPGSALLLVPARGKPTPSNVEKLTPYVDRLSGFLARAPVSWPRFQDWEGESRGAGGQGTWGCFISERPLARITITRAPEPRENAPQCPEQQGLAASWAPALCLLLGFAAEARGLDSNPISASRCPQEEVKQGTAAASQGCRGDQQEGRCDKAWLSP